MAHAAAGSRPVPSRRPSLLVLGAVGLAVAILALFWLLRGGAEAPDTAQAELAAVAENPAGFYGRQVTVGGEVSQRGRRAFVIEARGEALLIVPQQDGGGAGFDAGDAVVASGVVRQVPPGSDPGLLGERELFDEWAGRPSLAATQIREP